MIRTERLLLRPLGQDDAPFMLGLFSHPDVHPWSGDGTAMPDLDAARARIARGPQRAGPHPDTGIFAVVPDGGEQPVGIAMLVPLPASGGAESTETEVGWHLHPDAWGRGYATEAALALLARAGDAGITEVHAVTNPDNVRSQAVCRRLGMIDLGLRDDWYDLTLRAFRIATG